jgi:enoyl-CoA hydratase/carnithine racemase
VLDEVSHRIGEVLIETRDPVVTATIDRPRVRNAINQGVVDGLSAAVEIALDRRATVLVLRGSGGTFCAGADLGLVAGLRDEPAELDSFMARLGSVLDRFETAPFAVLAVVEGFAVAGGLELLLACDVVLAAADAKIGDGHLEYGLVPAAGSSVRLTRRLPRARANYLLLSAELLTGEQAAAWGLVTAAVEPARLATVSERVIAGIASRSRHGVGVLKKMIRSAGELTEAEALPRERELFRLHVASRDAADGLAAFQAGRTPALAVAEGRAG